MSTSSPSERAVTLGDVAPLSLGAAILGTGGGGNPYLGSLALRRCIETYERSPKLIPLASLPDDAFVVSVGMSGSPSVGLEKVLADSYMTAPLRRLEGYMGRPVDAIMPLEVGGVNSLFPLMAGCATGVPVIDADGMGRAFPTLEKTVFAAAGLSPHPSVLFNAHEDSLIFVEDDPDRRKATEGIRRAALTAMGGACAAAHYPMGGRQAKSAAIAGTMSLALAIGEAVHSAREQKADPVEAVLDTLRHSDPGRFAHVLFEGKVVDIERDMIGGWNVGRGTLDGTDTCEGELSFEFQNEFLYAKRNGNLVAVVPDLVAFLDRETADPVTCETIRYSQRVKVVGISSSPKLRTRRALEICGPAAFDLAEIYRPIEDLAYSEINRMQLSLKGRSSEHSGRVVETW